MNDKARKLLGILLIISLVTLLIQVMLGGITRLTGSGLSMTEWKVIAGTIPPLNETQWQEKFELYKTIPQYQLLNNSMNLSEFKSIFFWEWAHRVWGRIGFVFLLGIFAIMGLRKQLDKRGIWLFGVLLLLYFFQGLLGWFMVYSGLSELVYVSHYRLAAHLLGALFLFAFILWWAADLLVPLNNKVHSPPLKKAAWGLTFLIVVQIIFGAFMSGLRAAGRYASWPDMNGQMVPDNLFMEGMPFLLNFSENHATIQFTHRGLAYLLCFLMLWYWSKARKFRGGRPWFSRAVNLLPILLACQVALGITTLLLSSGDYVPVFWGVVHQFMGLTLLSTMLFVNFQYTNVENVEKTSISTHKERDLVRS